MAEHKSKHKGDWTDSDLKFQWGPHMSMGMISDELVNLLILDEIFDSSLDTTGTDEFMRILYHTMNKENVFIISHKGDTLIDKFPRVMKFEKYKNFTRMAE